MDTAEQIVGRDAELAAAESFLDRAAERSAVLELVGDAGIGKTTVWRHIVERAESRGYRVLNCRAAERETKLALSSVRDLIQQLTPALFDALPPPQGRALKAAALMDEEAGTAPEPQTIGAAMQSLFAQLASEGPVLVAIDDTQWLDASSAAALAFALRRLDRSPVAWLLATRPVGSSLGVDRIDRDRVDLIEIGAHVVGRPPSCDRTKSRGRDDEIDAAPRARLIRWESFVRDRDRARFGKHGHRSRRPERCGAKSA